MNDAANLATVTLRRLAIEDLPWANERYAEIGFARSTAKDLLVAAEIGGVRVGVGRLVPLEPGVAEMGGIYTFPDWRRHGVASALVRHLVGTSPYPRLFCVPFKPLEAFYAGFGFRSPAPDLPLPDAIRNKVSWCEGRYPDPVSTLVMDARDFRLRRIDVLEDHDLDALADLLVNVVEGGASVGFMSPLTRDRAKTFWRQVGRGAASGERVLFAADDREGLCGTVQLVFPPQENQPHRGDVAKMLVHRRARRRGVGAALMQAAEDAARDHGRSVLVLDTASDDARRLYERQGWIRVGDIPDYALLPEGAPCATTFYHRHLGKPTP